MTPHVDPRLLDEASGEERAGMLAHAAACRSCRSAIAAYDPSLLFALLAGAPVPPRVLDAVSAAALRGIREPSRRAPLRAAAAAIALVAIGSGSLILRSSFAPSSAPVAALPRADVEVEATSPVSQVVDFTVGDTQVVMVYNAELEL